MRACKFSTCHAAHRSALSRGTPCSGTCAGLASELAELCQCLRAGISGSCASNTLCRHVAMDGGSAAKRKAESTPANAPQAAKVQRTRRGASSKQPWRYERWLAEPQTQLAVPRSSSASALRARLKRAADAWRPKLKRIADDQFSDEDAAPGVCARLLPNCAPPDACPALCNMLRHHDARCRSRCSTGHCPFHFCASCVRGRNSTACSANGGRLCGDRR